jgi:hypothetical protein
LPFAVKAVGTLVVFSPTIPMFSSIWIEEGFFDLIAHIGLLVKI